MLDLDGHRVNPVSPAPARATVLFFVRPDCPISNRYAHDVIEFQSQFGSRGVVFRLVYPGTNSTAQDIRKHMAQFNYSCPALRDPAHQLVKFCHARVTPEAAVLTPDGKLVYHGRIDDRYVALGQWRQEPTRRDLLQAITAVLDGTPVPPGGPAVGCTIPLAE